MVVNSAILYAGSVKRRMGGTSMEAKRTAELSSSATMTRPTDANVLPEFGVNYRRGDRGPLLSDGQKEIIRLRKLSQFPCVKNFPIS
jgi:hypothetical protein